MNDLIQRSRISVAALAMTSISTALLSGCGGGSSTPVVPGSVAIVTSQQADTTVKYGPATLLVPAGNAPNGARFQLQSIDPASSSLPVNNSSVVVVDGTQTLLENSKTNLSGTLTISISYDPAQLTAAAKGALTPRTDATPEDSLRIGTVVMQNGHPVWVASLINNQVDKTGHVVSAQVPNTDGKSSIYGLIILGPPAPPPADF